jgi:MYXO-CTERM domain-containing protein
MTRLNIVSAAAIALTSALAASRASAMPLPDSGSCIGATCLGVENTAFGVAFSAKANVGDSIAMYGESDRGTVARLHTVSGTGLKVDASASTAIGVYSESSGQNNAGPAVWGKADSDNLGVGVKGEAVPGGTAIWGKNVGGVAAWFDGNLYVSGSQYSFTSPTFTVYSDATLKKNVKPLEGALDQLLRLRGVTYEWKDPEAHGNQIGPQRGFIAKEVEKVIPEWVGADQKGVKTLNTRGLEAMLVESIRTLKSENDALRAQVSKMDDRVKALEAKSGVARADVNVNSAAWGLLALVGLAAIVRRRSPIDGRSLGRSTGESKSPIGALLVGIGLALARGRRRGSRRASDAPSRS